MKTALITGANKSIGFETAKQLIALGYYVYLGSRDLEKGKQAVKRLGNDRAEAVQIDVSDDDSIAGARKLIGSKTNSLDVLINNAGIREEHPQPPTMVETNTIRKVFNTNFFGSIEMTRRFIDLLKVSPEPRIVNVTSGLSSLTLHNDPNWKYAKFKGAAYGPSKTALNAYTVALAYELRDTAFKVNAVDPGYTATDFNEHRGTGTVENAAKIVVKYATLDTNGPTGKFFSNDVEDEGKQSPW
jgi:NAD(P)-dependent dehydrogenase (short-subunit alcohol dehydrogenase family)